jgi:hypothetical protein
VLPDDTTETRSVAAETRLPVQRVMPVTAATPDERATARTTWRFPGDGTGVSVDLSTEATDEPSGTRRPRHPLTLE